MVQQFRHILVPVDDTHLSDRTLDAALMMATRFESRVRVLFVRDEAGPLPTDEEEVEVTRKGLYDMVTRRGGSFPTDRVSVELRTGDPEEAILRAIEEDGVDLVVMGTHGRRGIKDQVLGSTTERVIRSTTKPVLVLREIDDDEKA